MDQIEVQATLNDIPSTFKRSTDTTWLQFVDSLTAALSRLTNAADGTTAQLVFQNAVNGWLDLWGLMLGIPRRTNEADSTYLGRILITIMGGAGPDQCILRWIFQAWGIAATITDNAPGAAGYKLTFPGIVSSAQIMQILQGIVVVRPAGVPFTAETTNIGTYLDTVNFLNAGQVTGAYLGGGTTPVSFTLGAGTNNSPPLVPTLFLTDPSINPATGQTIQNPGI